MAHHLCLGEAKHHGESESIKRDNSIIAAAAGYRLHSRLLKGAGEGKHLDPHSAQSIVGLRLAKCIWGIDGYVDMGITKQADHSCFGENGHNSTEIAGIDTASPSHRAGKATK